jgi:hypothetical protein
MFVFSRQRRWSVIIVARLARGIANAGVMWVCSGVLLAVLYMFLAPRPLAPRTTADSTAERV